MKAEELMIGDYIMFNKNIYIIEEISKKGWVHLIHNDGSECRVELSSDYILDGITPIPLTAEILEKNGFNETFWGGEWTNNKVDFILIEHNDGFRVTNTNIVLSGVHQLQHALRLCGIEKEISV